MQLKDVRRIVTGHNELGRSVVSEIGPSPKQFTLDIVNVRFQELWSTQQTPVVVSSGPDPCLGDVILPPPSHGTRLRVIDIPPDTPELLARSAEAMKGVFGRIGDGGASTASRHPAMHRTESVDYGVILEGEITLLLDDDELNLGVGDVVIQRGTNHAWANRSGKTCRILFVLIGGTFEPSLREKFLALEHTA